MIPKVRLKNIINLLKAASEEDEALFVSYMLSKRFPEYEEEPLDNQELAQAFENIMSEDFDSIRNPKAIIHWLVNESLEQLPSFYKKMLEESNASDFVRAIRGLDAANISTVLQDPSVISALDDKTSGGPDYYNYVMYTDSIMSQYFLNKFLRTLDEVGTYIENVESIDYDTVSEVKKVVPRGVQSLSNEVRSMVSEALTLWLDKVADAVVEKRGYYKDTLSTLIIASEDLIELSDKAKAIFVNEINSGYDIDIANNQELYIEKIKKAVSSGDLAALQRLQAGKYLPKYEKKMVASMVEVFSDNSAGWPDADKEWFFKDNFIIPFFQEYKEKYPDLLDSVVKILANKYPTYFLNIKDSHYGSSIKTLIDEKVPEESKEKYRALAIRGYIIGGHFMSDTVDIFNDDQIKKDVATVYQTIIREEDIAAAFPPDKLFALWKFSLSGLLEDMHSEWRDLIEFTYEDSGKIFQALIDSAAENSCVNIIELLYNRDSMAPQWREKFANIWFENLSENLEKNYKCYLEMKWKAQSVLEGDTYRRMNAMMKKVLRIVIEKNDSDSYFSHFYGNYSDNSPYALIPKPFEFALKRLEHVKELGEAKEIYDNSHNDVEVEPIIGSRIKHSGYQDAQRPAILTENAVRYELTQDNRAPSLVLYDINKNLVSAADFVGHTNIGSSGFTSAWALTSFPVFGKRLGFADGGEVMIEQIQSDYPVVLDRTFKRMPPTRTAYSGVPYREVKTGTKYNLVYEDGVELRRPRYGRDPDQYSFPLEDEEIMTEDDFMSYKERASQADSVASSYSSTEEEKIIAYKESSSIYRERALKIRKRLDELGVIPEGLYALREKYSKEDIDDAKKHIEVISQNYPYLVLIRAINTAQKMGRQNIYMLKSGGSAIQNKVKKNKLYVEMPKALGANEMGFQIEASDGSIGSVDVFEIPATEENIGKLRDMLPVKKKGDYDYSLTPMQNKRIYYERLKEERDKKKERQEQRDSELSVDKYLEAESILRSLFGEVDIEYKSPEKDTVTEILRYLGKSEKKLRESGVSKKRIQKARSKIINLRIAEIIMELGFKKTSSDKILALGVLLGQHNLSADLEKMYDIFEEIPYKNSIIRSV
jgi:hypothetical protein